MSGILKNAGLGVTKGQVEAKKPADLPRRPEVIDMSDAEKVCPSCQATKIRIGQIVCERLDY